MQHLMATYVVGEDAEQLELRPTPYPDHILLPRPELRPETIRKPRTPTYPPPSVRGQTLRII